MTLAPGTSLGPYEILSPLGAGGMGEVYRARDTQLDRNVAIKVMPAAMANDAERLARFEREAKVLAALSHPNIAQIYGLQEGEGTRALVMELVEGSTLPVPLPLATALNYARQITEALEAAHEKGITHRDLKPGNIMVTPQGVVKILDFGLASSPTSETGDPANSPTITMAAATQPGVILGTAAYMSPEQAAGKPIDKRSDIWSFGVVLYEMLTGARLFEGETLSHTLAHVLTRPVDLDKLPKDTPPAILTLLRRCLDRDSKTRLRDIGEARVAIDRYLADPTPAPAALPSTSALRLRRVAPWLIAAVVLALAAGLAWRLFQRPASPLPVVRFTVPIPPKSTVGSYESMALSPDGRYLAFTANFGASLASTQIWLRPLDSVESHPLPGTNGAAFMFWSPDSRFIAFYTTDGLKKIPVEGGPAVSLTRLHPFGGSWNRNGIILIGNRNGPVYQVPEGGGEGKPVLALDKSHNESAQTWPQFLPDGRHFLYLSQSPGQTAIYLAELGSIQTRKVMDTEAQAAYAQGHLLFLRAQTLMAQPLDPSSGKLTGASFPLAEKVGTMPELLGSLFSTSETGALAFRTGSEAVSVIAIFNRKGERLGAAGPPSDYAQITLSPDDRRLAIDRRQNGNYDIWILELTTGVFSRVTFDAANDRDPVFSPDGSQIVFTNDRLGRPHLYRKTIGGGPDELIYRGPDREASEAWLKDGSILFGNLGGRKYFLLRPGETGEPKLVYQSEFSMDEPAISPDGKWVAYGSDESGQWEAYVARFPQWDQRKQISTDGGMQPHWRQDGREIIYATSDARLMSVNVTPGATFEAASPALLFASGLHARGQVEQWTMLHDASKFYVLSSLQEGDKPITVMLNWRK